MIGNRLYDYFVALKTTDLTVARESSADRLSRRMLKHLRNGVTG